MYFFSLLKFWQNAGFDSAGGGDLDATITASFNGSTPNNLRHHQLVQLVESDDENDGEESFFDLEFTLPSGTRKEETKSKHVDISIFDNKGDQYNNLAKKGGETALKFVEFPNDVFFKGRIVSLEPRSKPQSPISLLRSAPNFGVLMLGYKKSKSQRTETRGVSMATPKHQTQKPSDHEESKRFTVKWKVEEVPVVSLFTRDYSLKGNIEKQSSDNASSENSPKRFPKDLVHKYLKLIKPLYVRVSKRNSAKMKFSDQLSPATALTCSPKMQEEEKQGIRLAALRVVCRKLGRSRSASSAIGIMPSPASKRDDTLQQQHDGIQSAILHCKRSFNSSSSRDSSLLFRSASDPFQEKSIDPPRNSGEESKRSRV